MDSTKPAKINWFLRLDRACQRIPGLGILLCAMGIHFLWTGGLYILLVVFAASALLLIIDEFAPVLGAIIFPTNSSPTS